MKFMKAPTKNAEETTTAREYYEMSRENLDLSNKTLKEAIQYRSYQDEVVSIDFAHPELVFSGLAILIFSYACIRLTRKEY